MKLLHAAFFSLFLALSIPAFVHGSDDALEPRSAVDDPLLPRTAVFEGRWVKQRAAEEPKPGATAADTSGSGSGSDTKPETQQDQDQSQDQGQGQDQDQSQDQDQGQGQDQTDGSSSSSTQEGSHTGSIHTAGAEAKAACEGLLKSYTPTDLKLNGTFVQYWEQGSNPSFELLSSIYPKDVLPKRPPLNTLLLAVAPDYDVTGDSGYGASGSPVANNGPMGGLPAFCRFGSFIKTSDTTEVLAEVWLPLAYNPSIKLAAINQTDFPTNSTPVRLDKGGNYIKKPLWVTKALDKKEDPSEDPATDKKQSLDSDQDQKQTDKKGTKSKQDDDQDQEQTGKESTKSKQDDEQDQEQTGKESTKSKQDDDQDQEQTDKESSKTEQDDEPHDFNHLADATPFANHFLMGTTDPQDSQGSSNQKREEADSKPHKHHNGDGKTHGHHNGDHHHYSGPMDGFKLLGLKGSNDGWNGRLLYVGNGGFRGYVPFAGIKQALSRYRFAAVGSNAGHFSTTGGATWINGTQREDTLKDWGYRATSVSQQLGREVVKAFYGQSPKKAYFNGCSNGGKAGLASAQEDPGLFDGIIAGSPGVDFARMNAAQIAFQKHHNPNYTDDAWFSVNFTQYSVHQTILDQCDHLDGVRDGVVNNPLKCQPNFEKDLLCGASGAKYGGSNETCLTQAQIDNLKGLYKPLYLNDTFIYDAFPVTWEQRSDGLVGSAKKAGGLYELAVVKAPNQEDSDFNYWKDIDADLVKKAETEGAAWDSGKTDLSATFKAGTKIMSYHGLSDLTISPYNTIRYWQKVAKDSGGSGDISENVRFYPISGMSHCRDGEGAWHFGGASQYDPGNRPLSFDTRHDILLSLIAWVEKNHQEPYQVGAHYEPKQKVLPPSPTSSGDAVKDVDLPTYFEEFGYGVVNTRKHCPWPQQAMYKGGETDGEDGYQSYSCEKGDWGQLPQ